MLLVSKPLKSKVDTLSKYANIPLPLVLASTEPFSLPIDISYKLLLSLSVYHNIILPSCFEDISLLYFASFGTTLVFSMFIDSI